MHRFSILSILAHGTPTPTSRSKGQKSKSRAGAYCGGHLTAQLVIYIFIRHNMTESNMQKEQEKRKKKQLLYKLNITFIAGPPRVNHRGRRRRLSVRPLSVPLLYLEN